MTKAEILALGVPSESVREFQTLYNRDLSKAIARAKDSPSATRDAITAMLPMIRQSDNLRRLLTETNYLYYAENRPPRLQEDPPTTVEEATTPRVEL